MLSVLLEPNAQVARKEAGEMAGAQTVGARSELCDLP